MAEAWVAPSASKSLGKCVAIAAETNQQAANTSDSSTIVHRTTTAAPAGTGGSAGGGNAFGTSNRLSGNPIKTCRRAHARQAPRQPNASMNKALAGQPTVLAKPANSVIPVMALR